MNFIIFSRFIKLPASIFKDFVHFLIINDKNNKNLYLNDYNNTYSRLQKLRKIIINNREPSDIILTLSRELSISFRSNVVSDLLHLMEFIDLTLFVRFATKTATKFIVLFCDSMISWINYRGLHGRFCPSFRDLFVVV